MTYGEAKESGYKAADRKYQSGYVSRRADIYGQPVHTAGGSRRGQKYVLLPCYHTTRYCYRQYLEN